MSGPRPANGVLVEPVTVDVRGSTDPLPAGGAPPLDARAAARPRRRTTASSGTSSSPWAALAVAVGAEQVVGRCGLLGNVPRVGER